MTISDERRKPDRAPWGMACSGCHGKGKPGQADIRYSGIKKNGRAILVHVWEPNIATSEHCQGVPDRRKPKREHILRGPDRRKGVKSRRNAFLRDGMIYPGDNWGRRLTGRDRRSVASAVAAPALLCEFCHGTGRAPNSQFSCHHCDKRMEV